MRNCSITLGLCLAMLVSVTSVQGSGPGITTASAVEQMEMQHSADLVTAATVDFEQVLEVPSSSYDTATGKAFTAQSTLDPVEVDPDPCRSTLPGCVTDSFTVVSKPRIGGRNAPVLRATLHASSRIIPFHRTGGDTRLCSLSSGVAPRFI